MTSALIHKNHLSIHRLDDGGWMVWVPIPYADDRRPGDDVSPYGDSFWDEFEDAVNFVRQLLLPPPRADEIVVWDCTQERGLGFYDAWNGWYETETDALTDGVPPFELFCTGQRFCDDLAEYARQTRRLNHGEDLLSEDQLLEMGRIT